MRLRSKSLTAAIAAGIAMLAAGTALAGDPAQLNILGFSPDGKIFAFEEFGVQDGSGFPYANRYYVDTATDTFLPGTPIRVRIDQDGGTEAAAREQARERAQSIIPDQTLAEHRGWTAAANAITERSADPFRLSVNPRPIFPPADQPLEIRLEERSMPDADRCSGLGEIKGFRLVRLGSPDAAGEVLHEDEQVPESRGCPTGYRLGGVQTYHPSAGQPVFAVMVIVERVGFEGPDHRWLAVTGRLP